MEKLINNIKLEAFDIFAYLLPGSIFLGALSIAHWAWVYPNKPIFIPDGTKTWIIIVVIAYIFGHIVQGIGELIVKRFESFVKKHKEEYNQYYPVSPDHGCSKCRILRSLDRLIKTFLPSQLPESKELKSLARDRIGAILKRNKDEIGEDLLNHFCIKFIEHYGLSESRKILQHRAAMFLGLAISLFVLFASLIFLLYRTTEFTHLQFESSYYAIYQRGIIFFTIITFLGMLIAIYRYILFNSYRERDVILSFLTLNINR